ncbi:MAG: hypothetical protein SNJ66_09555, partial [Chloroherpetonaceae bacterium]
MAIRKLQHVQLRTRERRKNISFFLTYTKDGKQHQEILTSVPKRDKEAYRRALDYCEELARKRDAELAQGVAGTAYIAARNQSFIAFAELVQNSKRTPEPYRKALLKLKAFLAT